MHEVIRDLHRLHLMEDGVATESLSTRISDFFRYYFTRFLSNLTHAFKPFSMSEIKRWNKLHHFRGTVFNQQLKERGDKLVPIPKGMIHSYRATLISLTDILKDVSFDTAKIDTQSLLKTLATSRGQTEIPPFTQTKFNQSRDKLSGLFAEMGLAHRPARDVFVSSTETMVTNNELQHITYLLYQDIVEISKLLPKLESYHRSRSVNVDHSEEIKSACMSLGYRLTIMAITADHVQKLEHQFVEGLNIITQG